MAGASSAPIVRVEPIAVGLPMRHAMRMAGVVVDRADNLLVRITDEEGRVGWGEAASAPTMTGELLAGMAAAVRHLAPALVGATAEAALADAGRQRDRLLLGNDSAKAAIDIALHDLAGRASGQPVHARFGALRRERVPVLWLVGTGSTEGDVAEAAAKRAQGFVAFKIKVGTGTPLADAERTRRVRAAIGDGALVSADANQGWSADEAAAYLAAVDDLRLDFVEQPMASDDLGALAALARASRTPIGVDEGIHSSDDIRRHHAAGAAAGCSLKAIKLGGLGAVADAAALCGSLGLRVNLACKIAESGIATAAVLHLAAALPSLDWGVSLSNQYLAEDVLRDPPAVERGHAGVPKGPGLGVEVDEDRVDRHRL